MRKIERSHHPPCNFEHRVRPPNKRHRSMSQIRHSRAPVKMSEFVPLTCSCSSDARTGRNRQRQRSGLVPVHMLRYMPKTLGVLGGNVMRPATMATTLNSQKHLLLRLGPRYGKGKSEFTHLVNSSSCRWAWESEPDCPETTRIVIASPVNLPNVRMSTTVQR